MKEENLYGFISTPTQGISMGKAATLEDIQEIIRDLGHSQKKTQESLQETQRAMGESQEKTQRAMKESRKETEKSLQETQRAMKESRKETEESIQETQKSLQKTQESLQETEKTMRESRKETEKSLQKTQESLQNLNKSLDKASGNFNNKWGAFMEGLVKGDIVRLLNEWNIQVEKVMPRVKIRRKDNTIKNEYDLIVVNGSEIVVIEVKTTLSVEKLNVFMDKMVRFKKNFPEYSDKNIYGGVAYIEADGESAKNAEKEGLFVIEAPGGPTSVSTIVNGQGFKPKTF